MTNMVNMINKVNMRTIGIQQVQYITCMGTFAFAVSCAVYVLVTRLHPTPLRDSYTERQQQLLYNSRTARRAVYRYAACCGLMAAFCVHFVL